jgi:hypothetical protein
VPPTNPYQSSNTKERGSPQPGTSPSEPQPFKDLFPQKLSNSNSEHAVGHRATVSNETVGDRSARQPDRPHRCPEHAHIVNDSDVPPCRACMALRLAAEDLAAAERAAEAEQRRAAIDNCTRCDENGLIDVDNEGTIVTHCDHQATVTP